MKTPISEVAFTTVMRPCRWGWMLYPKNDKFVGGAFEHYGEYSPVEIKFLSCVLNPGDVVINAGANIGALAIPMAQRVGSKGLVLAFEPQGFIYSLLRANIAINGIENIATFYAAVGKEEGTIRVPCYDYDKGDNFSGLGRADWMKYNDGVDVSIVTVDSLNLARLDLLQADVELMEQDVLEGAKDTIKRLRPLLFIENDKGVGAKEKIEYVYGLDYTPYWVATSLFDKDNYFENSKNIYDSACSFNMYCIPNERKGYAIKDLRQAHVDDPVWDEQNNASFPMTWTLMDIKRLVP